ncbi:hypothetical protein SPI_08797 [Niveomyces insectorum RCEF 264]|uniref:Uncharacterized protein n=1 Tax=Niveomyces insectorum RCEF 264 TaxID=1081102 RepID=A0A167MMV5_9HYPO|nr:hypothetical protein SPI_08797 [Niveomyces insectorum RCEF 264]
MGKPSKETRRKRRKEDRQRSASDSVSVPGPLPALAAANTPSASMTRLYAGFGSAAFFVRYGHTFYAYDDDTRGTSHAFSLAPDGGPPSGHCRYAPYSGASLYGVAIFYTPGYGQYAWSRAYSYSSSRYGKSL